MCASYGLSGGPQELGLTFGLPPMHEPENQKLLAEWAREYRGKASITGKLAKNLNPLIHEGYGERTIELGWWWLYVGSNPAPFSAFNARDDNLLSKWRHPLQRRAILPANWYVEKGQTFAMPENELFGIAAIVTPVPRAEGPALLTYSMVTRASLARAADVHPRMPLLLPREVYDTWLDPKRPGDAALVAETVRASDGFVEDIVIVQGTDTRH